MNPQGTTSGMSLQGSSNTIQQTAPVQIAAGGFQPAVNPSGYTSFPSTTPQAQPAVTAVDQSTIQKNNVQKSIQKLIGETMNIYDTLYGNLQTAAASQRQALESKYGTESGALSEQFAQEIPRIGQGYAGRGAYDSSWRIEAEKAAQSQFAKQLQQLQEEQKTAGIKLGQEVATQESQFKAGQSGLNQLLARLPSITDVTELTTIQNEIQKKINDLQASAAGLQSQEAYLQRFQQLSPATNKTEQLRKTLTTIIGGGAPIPLKQSVANQIIQSSGLTPEEQQVLANEVAAQLTPSTVTA